MDIAALRKTLQKNGLRRSTLASLPMEQFGRWLERARTAGLTEHDTMSVATASADGRPRVRTVRLRGHDGAGFLFYTHERTVKVEHLTVNPSVSLLFPWLELNRQVIVEGRAEKLKRGEILRHFLTRSRGHQLETWLSMQEKAVGSGRMFLMELDAIRKRFAAGKVPLPQLFVGYRVRPEMMEFWQGRRVGLPDRLVYSRRGEADWELTRVD